jgi:hypothetical protein
VAKEYWVSAQWRSRIAKYIKNKDKPTEIICQNVTSIPNKGHRMLTILVDS